MSMDIVNEEGEQTGTGLPDTHDPLFQIDGKWYGIPKTIPANTMFRYLRDLKREGSGTAEANMMYVVLGESAVDALAECEDMTNDDLVMLMGIVKKKTMGMMEKLSGN